MLPYFIHYISFHVKAELYGNDINKQKYSDYERRLSTHVWTLQISIKDIEYIYT